jgi:hypothetical protein
LDIGRSLTMARYYNLSLRSTKIHNQTTLVRTNGGEQCFFLTFFCHFAKRKGPTTSSKAFRKNSNKIPEESYEITKKIGRF